MALKALPLTSNLQDTPEMLRFAVRRVAVQFRRSHKKIEPESRIGWQSKIHGFMGSCLKQQPLLLRTFSSIVESYNEILGTRKKKLKKLLEPSRFDNAITFEQAFGRKVICWRHLTYATLP